MAVRERVRIGGRSARIQSEVHKAVKELQAEAGRTELTVPMIATRAGVTPSTIYRRWGDLAELVADVAMERLKPAADPEDRGGLKDDLAAYIEQYAEEFSTPTGKTLLLDLFSSALDGPYPAEYCNYTYDHLQVILDRATARGEKSCPVQDVVDLVIAPIMYRILFGKGEVTEAYWRGLLDRLSIMAK